MIQGNEICELVFSVNRHCDFVGVRIGPFLVNMTWWRGGETEQGHCSVRGSHGSEVNTKGNTPLS